MIGRRSNEDAQSFEDAWSGRAPRDEHIAELVRIAENLCEAAVVEPSIQFQGALRTRLMVEAESVLVPVATTPRPVTPVRDLHPVRRRVAAVTATLIAAAGVVGLVGSSASAVPGEMLYPVKRGVESVELALHRDDASRGTFQLAQATERLAEARNLSASNGSDELIAASLDDFASQAQSGSTSLFSDFTDSGSEKSIRTVNDFTAAATVDLSDLSSQLPSGADDSFAAATEAIRDLATQASSMCPTCTTANVSKLVAAVADLAKSTSATGSSRTAKDSKSKSSSDSESTTSRPEAQQTTQVPPLVVLPTTSPAEDPAVSGVIDPVVGALLGDSDQEGLVPGLLNGVLNP